MANYKYYTYCIGSKKYILRIILLLKIIKINMKILQRKKFTILKNIISYSFVFTIALSLMMSVVAVHSTLAENGIGNVVTTKIENPLGEGHLATIPAFIEQLLTIVIKIGVPVITLAIIYAGFLFVQAQGNPEKLKTAKKTLLYTIIGAFLLLGAYVFANAIGSTVKDITSTT